MYNLLCMSMQELKDKLELSGVVVLLGVGLVFLLLALLILVVKLLRVIDFGMDKWDIQMSIYRAKKHECNVLKTIFDNKYDEEITLEIVKRSEGEIDAAVAKSNIAAIKARKKLDKVNLLEAITVVKARYKAEAIERKELKLKEKQEKALNKNNKSQILMEDVEENVALEVVETNDDAVVAVITAAIACVLNKENSSKQTKFRVRSIKEIK